MTSFPINTTVLVKDYTSTPCQKCINKKMMLVNCNGIEVYFCAMCDATLSKSDSSPISEDISKTIKKQRSEFMPRLNGVQTNSESSSTTTKKAGFYFGGVGQ